MLIIILEASEEHHSLSRIHKLILYPKILKKTYRKYMVRQKCVIKINFTGLKMVTLSERVKDKMFLILLNLLKYILLTLGKRLNLTTG
jgi:hypothetical protein